MYVKAEIGKMWVSYHEMQLYTLSRSLFSVCDIVISRSFFFKKRRGYCNRVCQSFMLSPKPLEEIQQICLCVFLS